MEWTRRLAGGPAPSDDGDVEGTAPAPGGPGVALRPAGPADSEFCYRLHRAAMGEYVTALYGWDEQLQRGHQDRAFKPGRWQIITADGADVGMIDVERRPAEIYLGRIEILPAWQGRGIGTRLISALIAEAHGLGQELTLEVFAVNRRAKALYRRLGLRETAVHGEGGRKVTMRSAPPER
jgi:ribosomal protein S18 acetylase RimI-like enzyme